MARLLALDWDQQEARYVVAHTRGTQLLVEAAASVSLHTADGGTSRLHLGPALQAALAPYKVSRAVTCVAVERSQIEFLDLTLPPSSDAELPELVHNLAMRESNAITEDCSLDFVPLNDDPGEPRNVAVMALSQHRLEQVQAVCADVGVVPGAIGLRPYGAAALLMRSSPARDQTCLLINVFAEEIDLSVVARGKVVFWRTLRQANVSHDTAAARKLIAEINRTLVVAKSHLDGQSIEEAYLFGSLAEHPVLGEQLRNDLAVTVTLVDPLAEFTTPSGDEPETPGRFASLLGMLTVEVQRGSHAVDFLHPRKKPQPPNHRRTLTLAGAATALVLLLGGYRVWSTFAESATEIDSLSQQLSQLDEQFKRAGKQQKVIQAIRDWNQDDVNWLDELRDLSLRFPSSRDAVILRMGLSHARGSGGTVDMVGVVRDPAIVSRIESNLRDKHHQISSRHVQERVQENSYSWHFESSLIVTPRDKTQYLSHLPHRPEPGEEPEDSPQPSPAAETPARPSVSKR